MLKSDKYLDAYLNFLELMADYKYMHAKDYKILDDIYIKYQYAGGKDLYINQQANQQKEEK